MILPSPTKLNTNTHNNNNNIAREYREAEIEIEMWESSGCVWRCISISPVKIILDSLKIVANNKVLFSSIMALTTLPLSALTIWESTLTHTLIFRIHDLEALARQAHTRFEARHVFKESRNEALSLLRIKALFSIPSYLLSLAAALSAVHFSLTASPSLRSTASSVAHSWHRLFFTSIFVYAALFAFSPVPRLLAAITATSSAWIRLLALAIGSGLEVYLMAVLSLGLVVSVAEERLGLDAIRVGYGLMEGRKSCATVLSVLFVAVSSLIGLKVEALVEGETGVWEKAIVIFLYAMVVLWSYVIITVFYCDCRKRHPIKEPLPDHDHHHHHHHHQQQLEMSP